MPIEIVTAPARAREVGMRVAVGPVPRTGGVRTHVLGLARFSQYHPVLFDEPPWSPFHPFFRGLRTWFLRHPQFPIIDPHVRLGLTSKMHSMDVLHTHGHPVWIDLYETAPRWKLRRVHTVHQVYVEQDARTPQEWQRLSKLNESLFDYCRTAHATIAVSFHIRQALGRQGVPNVVEIPSGIDPAELDRANPARSRERFRLPSDFVVSIGHTGAVKNPAFSAGVAAAIAPMPFVAIGPGMTSEGLHQVGITAPGNMLCLGPLPHGEVLDILAASSIFFLPSAREGLSIATLEAMGVGVPCVVPDLPGLQQVTENGAVARLYPAGDVDGVLTAIDDARRDRTLGERARASCRRRYDWRQVARRIDAVYESLVDESS